MGFQPVDKRTGLHIAVAAESSNRKTGNVPTVWLRNLDDARASCQGCKQYDDGTCYAHGGTPVIGQTSVTRTAARAKSWRRYHIRRALADRHHAAKMIRFTALGDAARCDRGEVREAMREAKRAGLSIVGYTHFWGSDGAWLRGRLMASCDDVEHARAANAAGWRATIVVPAGTTGTMRNADGSVFAVECPAIAAERLGKKYTCNECASTRRGALCDASKPGPNVYFADHGPVERERKRRLTVLA